MKSLFKDILVTGLGALVITKEKAEGLIEKMVKQGDITREEGKELLQKFLQKSEEKTDKLTQRITGDIKDRLHQAGFATKKDLEELQLQINDLKEEIHSLKMDNSDETREE